MMHHFEEAYCYYLHLPGCHVVAISIRAGVIGLKLSVFSLSQILFRGTRMDESAIAI
jgi:hypothetical protein